ncbi:quinone-dependent dihydroorotate dehydrogenase [Paenibacillus flagellatus]|uniref:Dihydroorotate dehydrogenase (quinone) n=1 Tax=Paenibacillus flagellatus TaxID=2211139 RepID=A0A2V5KEE9_9BACL|nr:quinone-dependent dihydroorotate dehydrogenase [Paenibacillus flagellatus]PYI56473.1 dihydroorotate dehydrogenase (quinone) [Paenibacillus flagellatus]
MLYRKLAKPVLFRIDPEQAHHITVDGLGSVSRVPGVPGLIRAMCGVESRPATKTELCGITFPNPIGLAAGLDKNAKAVRGFASLGFGFMEVGTVTPRPQKGNDKPRLFRLPPDEALVNRMGFNNVGAAAMADHLKRAGRQPIPVAVNIGKNKDTPNEQAEEDYRTCIRTLYPYGDFFVVNISSPNTPGLRNLQHGAELQSLVAAVKDEMERRSAALKLPRKPVFVKIAPDVTEAELEYMVETLVASGVSGVIATNTTIGRDGLAHPNAKETGGLSGKPLTKRSTEVIRSVYRLTGGKLPIIGSGGIFTPQDAYEKIRAGASLVEVYTALIYKGPGLLRELNEGLLGLLARDGFTHLSEAVGADAQA